MAKKTKATTMAKRVVDENAVILLAYYKHDGRTARVLEDYSVHPVSKVRDDWYKIQYMEGQKHFAYVLGKDLTKMPEGYKQVMSWH